VDLTDVRVTRGVDFDFTGSDVTALGPGECVLIVRNRSAFEFRYGTALPVAGAYGPRRLSNDGETIKLEDPLNNTIQEFTYDVSAAMGWPVAADGNGPSMEIVDAFGDYEQGENWQASRLIHGSPGGHGGINDRPPTRAMNPRPATGAELVELMALLQWTPGQGASRHHLFMGTSNPPELVGRPFEAVYFVGRLQPQTTYYWRIDEINAYGATTGTLWSFTTGTGTEFPGFIRGDFDLGGSIAIADAVQILLYLFAGARTSCLDPADVNDDGTVDITDPIYLLLFLFRSDSPPPPPFPTCGEDPTPDLLPCVDLPPCSRSG
jgi:hypothetical protein